MAAAIIDREKIYKALFDLVEGSADFVYTSRRWLNYSNVPPGQQPALFLVQGKQTGQVKRLGAPTVWTLEADIIIYAHSADPYGPPSAILNPLVDAVEKAIAPETPDINLGTRNDLGLYPMVQHCYIDGTIETDEGLLGDQGYVAIPIKILCASHN